MKGTEKYERDGKKGILTWLSDSDIICSAKGFIHSNNSSPNEECAFV